MNIRQLKLFAYLTSSKYHVSKICFYEKISDVSDLFNSNMTWGAWECKQNMVMRMTQNIKLFMLLAKAVTLSGKKRKLDQ